MIYLAAYITLVGLALAWNWCRLDHSSSASCPGSESHDSFSGLVTHAGGAGKSDNKEAS